MSCRQPIDGRVGPGDEADKQSAAPLPTGIAVTRGVLMEACNVSREMWDNWSARGLLPASKTRGLTLDDMKNWSRAGLLPICGRRNGRRWTAYSLEDVLALKVFLEMAALGFSLAVAKRISEQVMAVEAAGQAGQFCDVFLDGGHCLTVDLTSARLAVQAAARLFCHKATR